MRPHILNLYQNPRQGGMNGAWLNSVPASDYRHRIVAQGGFDTASASLAINASQARTFFDTMLGSVVRVVVDNPAEPAWEGFINRITFKPGARVFTTSFDEMMNRAAVNYWIKPSPTVAADPGQIARVSATATLRSQDSIARYGTKDGVIEGHVQWNTNNTHKQALADKLLAERAYPQISVTDGGGDALIEVEMLGLVYYAYDWIEYNQRAVGDNAAVTFSDAFLNFAITNRQGPNAQYVVMTTASYTLAEARADVVTNTAADLNLFDSSSGTNYQKISQLVEAGGGASGAWVWGIGMFDRNSRTRRIYYRPANTAIEYLVSAMGDSGRVYNLSGKIIEGHLVEPDKGFRITDIGLGAPSFGQDVIAGYIDAIDYDGNTGRVSIATADDIQVEGVIGANRFYQQPGRRLKNAKPRQQV